MQEVRKQVGQVTDELSGAAHDVYAQAAESASRVAEVTGKAARASAGSFEKSLRNTIENQPYTAVAVALGLGWLLGRTHRPL